MKLLITGASSSVGLEIYKRLQTLGHEAYSVDIGQTKKWRLGDLLPPSDADVLIHLAHDRDLSIKQNIVAANRICESFKGRIIFLSSLSAHSQSRSKYGRSKFNIEKIFLRESGIILRAGIIFGKDINGIYLKLVNILKKFRIIPIPYRGNSILFVTDIDDLVNEIIFVINSKVASPIFAAHYFPISLYELLEQISKKENLLNRFVLIPSQPFDIILRVISKLFTKFHILDSLLSVSKSVSYTELSKLVPPHTKFKKFSGNRI